MPNDCQTLRLWSGMAGVARTLVASDSAWVAGAEGALGATGAVGAAEA